MNEEKLNEYILVLKELNSLNDNNSIRNFLNNSSYEISEELNYSEIVDILKNKNISLTPEIIKLYILHHIFFNLVKHHKLNNLEEKLNKTHYILFNLKKITKSDLLNLSSFVTNYKNNNT